MRKKGQSLLEFLMIFVILILILKSLFFMLYLLYGKVWAEHHLYQSLICQAKGMPPQTCSDQALRQITKQISIGDFSDFKTMNKNHIWKGETKWNINSFNIAIKQQLHLP